MGENLRCELLSWDDVWNLSMIVAKKIRESRYNPDTIIGVTRGGWVPAMNLSDLLMIKDLLTLKVEHWGVTATPTGDAKLKFPLSVDLTGKKILLVDDLTDTGESIELSIEHIKRLNPERIKTATLLHNMRSRFEPDFYAERRKEWRWIIFPWNITEDLTNLVNRIPGKERMNPIQLQNALRKRFDLRIRRKILYEILHWNDRLRWNCIHTR